MTRLISIVRWLYNFDKENSRIKLNPIIYYKKIEMEIIKIVFYLLSDI